MAGPQIPKDFRRVIVAASVGNVIEWYDFYIFGSLAAVLSVKFFEQSHPVAALLRSRCLRQDFSSVRWEHSCSDGWVTGSAANIPFSSRLAEWDWALGRSD